MIRPPTLNSFSYTYGNPVNFRDPTGLDTCSDHPNGECLSPEKYGAYRTCQNVLATEWENCIQNALALLQQPFTPGLFPNSFSDVNDIYSASSGGWEFLRGIGMTTSGFKIVVPNNPTYPNQVIVLGSREVLEQFGLPANFRHAKSYHPLLEQFQLTHILRGLKGTALFTVGANTLDYTIGENAQYSLGTRYLAANTVDLAASLGFPAIGAVIGSAVPAGGTAIGFGVGVGADITFRIGFPQQHDAAVVWVDNQVYTPSAIFIDAHIIQPSITSMSCGGAPLVIELDGEVYELRNEYTNAFYHGH